MSGDALINGLKKNISSKVMAVGSKCKAVLCCRVSPK
jgi:hypothetical protein